MLRWLGPKSGFALPATRTLEFWIGQLPDVGSFHYCVVPALRRILVSEREGFLYCLQLQYRRALTFRALDRLFHLPILFLQ